MTGRLILAVVGGRGDGAGVGGVFGRQPGRGSSREATIDGVGTTSPVRPGLGVRIGAALRGWVRIDAAYAYRRAGGVVYEELMLAEGIRQQLLLAGQDLRTAPPGIRSQLICTWNAFALQSLGEAFLDGAPAAAATLPGYLPRITVAQATVFLAEVAYWSSQTRRAGVDAGYDITAQRPIPAPLPSWIESRPCPREHVRAMLDAGAAMLDKTEAALADFHRAEANAGHDGDASVLAGMAADADAALAYAAAMFTPDARQPVHEALEESVRHAVESYFRLGQLMAAPALLDHLPPTPVARPYPAEPYGWVAEPRRDRGGC